MSADWKPGDVVAATVDDRENVRLVAGWSRYGPQLRWCEMSPRWGDGDDDECWFMPDRVTNHRRLVAIDPEDREAVERLARARWEAYREAASSKPCSFDGLAEGSRQERIDWMQAALREFAAPKPLKPEEPTGLGAVVEDEDGVRWVRAGLTRGSKPDDWRCLEGERVGWWSEWRNLSAVRILSPGVEVDQ